MFKYWRVNYWVKITLQNDSKNYCTESTLNKANKKIYLPLFLHCFSWGLMCWALRTTPHFWPVFVFLQTDLCCREIIYTEVQHPSGAGVALDSRGNCDNVVYTVPWLDEGPKRDAEASSAPSSLYSEVQRHWGRSYRKLGFIVNSSTLSKADEDKVLIWEVYLKKHS